MGSLKGSQGPLVCSQDLTLRNTDQISWTKSHFIQQSTFEVHQSDITCFPIFRYVQGVSKYTNWMSGRVRTKNSILKIPYTYRNAQFLLLLRKKYPPRYYVAIKRSASIHLSNSLRFVCCISAKVELELKLPNKTKGSQESKCLEWFILKWQNKKMKRNVVWC